MLIKAIGKTNLEGFLMQLLAKVSPETAITKATSFTKAKITDKLNKVETVKKVKETKEKAKKTIKYLEKEILRNPVKVMEQLDKKLNIEDKRKLSNIISSNNEGKQVFLSSSWIQWAIWVPISENSTKGVLTLKLRVKRSVLGLPPPNPSGVYTFPLHGHPHGYGDYVDRSVYDVLRFSSSAGTDFWRVFYRSWYNTHRGVNYLQAPKNKK